MGSSVSYPRLGNSDIAYGYDEDWTFDGFHPIGYSSTDLYLRDVDTRTADLRLLSAPEQGLMDGGVDWVLGLFVLNKDVVSRDYTYASGLFISDFGVDRVAVYGELATEFASAWRVGLGRIVGWQVDYADSAGVRLPGR